MKTIHCTRRIALGAMTLAFVALAAASVAALQRGVVVRSIRFPAFAGRTLTTPRRQVLYTFSKDTRMQSNCVGACTRVFAPLLTAGVPRAGEGSGVRQRFLGVIKRTDGRNQVTYHGHPLYTYVNDYPQQATASGQRRFGGVWHAIDTQGKRPRPGNACFAHPPCIY